jgi:F0F1-type ATP synthase membrane subunit c/vacuolar-type H+-ATPase subunit K
MKTEQKKDLLGLALVEGVGLIVLSLGAYGLMLSASSETPSYASPMFVTILGAIIMVAGVALWADEVTPR